MSNEKLRNTTVATHSLDDQLPVLLMYSSIVLRHFSHLHSYILSSFHATIATANDRLLVARNSKNCATSPITSQGDALAASRPLAGINEHCATSLLSLSFFQVHRFLQHPRQQAPLLKCRPLLVWRFPHCPHWLVAMSIVLRHFSHFHSFRFTGSSSIPGNKRH
jgi:hypothetical protein